MILKDYAGPGKPWTLQQTLEYSLLFIVITLSEMVFQILLILDTIVCGDRKEIRRRLDCYWYAIKTLVQPATSRIYGFYLLLRPGLRGNVIKYDRPTEPVAQKDWQLEVIKDVAGGYREKANS